MSKIGKMITEAREERKLSQAELAKKTKISQVQISRIEGGEIKNPSFRDVEIISSALNMPLDLLRDGDFKKAPDQTRVPIGRALAIKEELTVPREENLLVLEKNNNNKATESLIEKSKRENMILISSNRIRKSSGLDLSSKKGDLFFEKKDPKRIRSLTELIKSMSGESNIKKLTSIEKDLAEGKTIKEVSDTFKLKLKEDDIKTIESLKEPVLEIGELYLSEGDLESLIVFQSALDQIISEELEISLLFLELGANPHPEYLIFLLEEAVSAGVSVRLILKREESGIEKYFPWILFIQTGSDNFDADTNRRIEKSTGKEGLLLSGDGDRNWIVIS